jgi:hypothetical protein
MEALDVIGVFYWEEINRLLGYVQWDDGNGSESLYQWMWVSYKLLFQGVTGSVKEQIQKVDGNICL